MLDKKHYKKKQKLVKRDHFWVLQQIKYIAQCSLGWGTQKWSQIWNRIKLWRRSNEVQTFNWWAIQLQYRSKAEKQINETQEHVNMRICEYLVRQKCKTEPITAM